MHRGTSITNNHNWWVLRPTTALLIWKYPPGHTSIISSNFIKVTVFYSRHWSKSNCDKWDTPPLSRKVISFVFMCLIIMLHLECDWNYLRIKLQELNFDEPLQTAAPTMAVSCNMKFHLVNCFSATSHCITLDRTQRFCTYHTQQQ